MSAKHVHYEVDPHEIVKHQRDVDDTDPEQAEQYAIWTPRSWSDNDSPQVSPSGTEFSKTDTRKSNTQVPSDLLDVIERQDAVIERLTTWCQTLEDQAVTHRMKIVEHEKAKEDYNLFCSKMNAELTSLKSSARRKAKEHSVEANILYERMQAKVDARVAAWCSRHEGISNRSGTPNKTARPKDYQQRTSLKSTGRSTTPLAPNASSKSSPGSATMSRSPSTAGKTRNSPRSAGVGNSSPRSSPLKRESRSTNLSPEPKQLINLLGSAACADQCFERRASPDATRPSKRRGQKSSAPSSQARSSATSLQTTPMSSFNSINYDMQRVIRDAASRTLATVSSNASLAEPGSPRLVPPSWSAPRRTTQISRRNRDGAGSPLQGPGQQATAALKPPLRQSQKPIVGPRVSADSNSTSQGFKFLPRSVSPPPLVSENVQRHGSPNVSRSPSGQIMMAAPIAPGDRQFGQKSHQLTRSSLQGRPVGRSLSPRSSFSPPQRGSPSAGRLAFEP